MGVRYLTTGDDDGSVMGQSASEKIGFFGATPVIQHATVVAAATDAATAITQLNLVITRLKSLGLLKS